MPRLLMIGGNRSTVGSIKALQAAGFEVVVAEKLPRQYALAAADKGLEIAPQDVEALDEAVRQLGGVAGIIGINEAAMTSAAALQQRFGLRGLAPEVISRTGSKLAQRECWAKDPELSVPFRILGSVDDLPSAIVEVGGFPVIVKPDRSEGGSRGVSLANGAEAARAAFVFAREQGLDGTQILVEAALSGPQFSAELVTKDGETAVLAIGRKVKSKPPYRVDLAIAYPGVTDEGNIAAIERMCGKTAAALGMTSGPGHIEFALTPKGPRPIELAARCGGSLTPDLAAHVSGCHPMVEAARVACGVPTSDWSQPQWRGAVLMFLTFPPGQAERLSLPPDLLEHPNVLDVDAWLPADGVIKPLRWTSQRIGYLGIIAENGPTALSQADKVSRSITVDYAGGTRHGPIEIVEAVEGIPS